MYLQSRKLYFQVSENKCQRPLFSFKLCVYLVTQSYLTLWDPWDCSPPGSSVHEIFQARILEWVAMPSSRGSFWPKDQNCASCISCTAGGFFFFFYFILLYNTALVLPYINMNLPRVYTCSPSWSPPPGFFLIASQNSYFALVS